MIERLSDELDVPLRERNALYLAAGFAPVHAERPFDDLGAARAAADAVLAGLEPNPALAVNVRWELLAANEAARALLATIPRHGAEPINVLTATLHPDGLAPRIKNYRQWRAHVVRRVRRQLERTAAPGLADLLRQLESYPVPEGAAVVADGVGDNELVVPLLLRTDMGDLSLLYTVTLFGAPRDVTLDEIAIETFFPADADTAALLRRATSHPVDSVDGRAA